MASSIPDRPAALAIRHDDAEASLQLAHDFAQIPTDPDTLLRRRPLSDALKAVGYPVAAASLATLAVRGGGPPFQRWGRIPLYRWGPSLHWAQSRLSAPVRSTSEFDVRAAAGCPVTAAPAIEERLSGSAGSTAEHEASATTPTITPDDRARLLEGQKAARAGPGPHRFRPHLPNRQAAAERQQAAAAPMVEDGPPQVYRARKP